MHSLTIKDIKLGIVILLISLFPLYYAAYLIGFPNFWKAVGAIFLYSAFEMLFLYGLRTIFSYENNDE